MHGVITARHTVTHAHTIVRLYGWRALGRCLWASAGLGNRRTFLQCVWM